MARPSCTTPPAAAKPKINEKPNITVGDGKKQATASASVETVVQPSSIICGDKNVRSASEEQNTPARDPVVYIMGEVP